ncbi:MAG: hypothetical protein CMA72_07445 [Euryarchaeota archaeon]|nr:hypothetical protein [Euryarchaeota archaeon]|tara:strand:- start:920 stop:3550 length:2631 start_codon:yes stop_codon:yes gene_type:complete
MTIQVSDPLQLLPYQSGAVTSPNKESAADASSSLTGPQQVAKIGEPVPIVFCRRRNNNGGVFVSPKATEARYENNVSIIVASETFDQSGTVLSQAVRGQEFVDIKLCLVISEGDMNPLKLNDMFFGECKRGTYAQTYDRRAGTWVPGNFIDNYLTGSITGSSLPTTAQSGQSYYLKDIGKVYHYQTAAVQNYLGFVTTDHVIHNFPEYCGTSGSYDNITVVSFEHRIFNLDNWNLQIHAFVREGMKVTRLIDNTLGPSDNFVDLAKYLIEKSSAVPSDLIDNTLLTSAANFCETNSFFYNGKLEQSINLSDWMQAHSYFFLLRFSKVNGKFAFRPTLPVNANNTIKTTTISYKYGFTESDLLPDGFEIQYIPLSERNAVIMQMMWREQPSGDIGFARTTNVKFSGTSSNGPFEQHDLSLFCTNENHAVKVGTYMLSRRRNIMHNLRIVVRPGSHSSILSVGDIVRVRLRRETAADQVEYHDFLYEIDRIEKTSTGPITYDLTHFPIDSQGRSVVALDVNGATGPGIVLDAGRQNFTCDINTASTDLPDVGREPFDGTGVTPKTPTPAEVDQELTPVGIDDPSSPDYVGGGGSSAGNAFPDGSSQPGAINNPTDPYDEQTTDPTPIIQGYTGTPKVGDTLTFAPGCANPLIKWYLLDSVTGEATQVASGVAQSYVVSTAAMEAGVSVYAEGCCPDPGAPGGYAVCIQSDTLTGLQPDIGAFSYARWIGTQTVTKAGQVLSVTAVTSPWTQYSSYLTITGLAGCQLGTNLIDYYSGSQRTFVTVSTGPVPWRSGVFAVAGICSGGNLALGGIGNGANGNPCSDGMFVTCSTGSNTTYQIQGRWEFSNDTVTAVTSWAGVDQSNVPDDAVPGNLNYPGN